MQFITQSQFLPRIEEIYLELQTKIAQVIPRSRIEHVGSSSIPGMISKGDLDIYLGVSPNDFYQTITLLASIGFYTKTDTLQTDSLRMMITQDYREDVAIQVVVNGTEYECFIDFRDKMRSNPTLIAAYNRLKLECEGLTESAYREVKSSFIETVLNTS